jgi:cyclic 2,3-diphosphoglycerate synthetase
VTRALALIDGEHYASTVRDALAELPYEFAGAVMMGGTEKLRDGADYGLAVYDDLGEALSELEPDVAVDLSDEPVLGPPNRFRVASRVLAAGVAYVGADFRFDPPELEPFDIPSIAVYADGKRVGKTAVCGHVARTLAVDRDVLVIAMGRGGPEEPELVESPPSVDDLLELSRRGRHAASDYLELAAVAGVRAIGCRRCGGGLAGAVAASNVPAGLELARERSPELVVFDGSGAAVPPVAVGKRVLVTSTFNEPREVTGYLNAYRILLADLAVVTMADGDTEHDRLADAIREVKPELPVVCASLRPRPLEPIDGRRVAYFTTAKGPVHERLAQGLRDDHGADVVCVSGSLSDRGSLRRDLESVDAEVFLTEVKAAGIDVVAETARERGVHVVLAANDVVPLPGQPDLDAELRALAAAAAAEPVST